MSTYAGVTFHGRLEDDGYRPHWMREKTIARRKLGGGNSEDLQDVGFGNYFIEFDARIDDDAGVATWQASVGLTKRTLGTFGGTNWPNVMLTFLGRPKRYVGPTETLWWVPVRFEYEAA